MLRLKWLAFLCSCFSSLPCLRQWKFRQREKQLFFVYVRMLLELHSWSNKEEKVTVSHVEEIIHVSQQQEKQRITFEKEK